ncbi:hypothetical protein ACSYAD_29835 [Acaryochloris marina NIES-2412]|uniref:hypothetical protein n=1 Tax=Acaryochloris marina TaxID=155978 RepID=UPI004058088C
MTNKIRLLAVVPLVLLGCSSQPQIAGDYGCKLKFKLTDRSTPISLLSISSSKIHLKLGKDNSFAMSIKDSPALLGTYEVDSEEIRFQTAPDRTDSFKITEQSDTSLVLGESKIVCVPKAAEGGD